MGHAITWESDVSVYWWSVVDELMHGAPVRCASQSKSKWKGITPIVKCMVST